MVLGYFLSIRYINPTNSHLRPVNEYI